MTAVFSLQWPSTNAAVTLAVICSFSFTAVIHFQSSQRPLLVCVGWLKCGDPSGFVRTYNKVTQASQLISSHYVFLFFILCCVRQNMWSSISLFLYSAVTQCGHVNFLWGKMWIETERNIKADSVPQDRKRKMINTLRLIAANSGTTLAALIFYRIEWMKICWFSFHVVAATWSHAK